MFTVPVSNMATNQQQADTTQISPENLSATAFQEILDEISRMTQTENTILQKEM